jgi:hypothetical protein
MSLPKSISLLFILCVTFFLSGCHHENDEPTGPQTILTLQVDADYGLEGDNWIFASDENGELLDVKSYADGQTVTLMSEKRPEKITVTRFQYKVQDSFGTVATLFNTWAAVPSGTTLHLKADISTGEGWADKAVIKVANYSGSVEQVGVSVASGAGVSSWLQSGNLELNLSFSGAPTDILIYCLRDGQPVYNWAKGVKTNDVIERDFITDFTPYPHQFKLNFEGNNSAAILGYHSTSSRPTLLLDSYWTDQSDNPIIGYLDGYDSYEMTVANVKANGTTRYHRKGDINYSFEIPTYTFSLVNSDMQNFSFNFSRDYTYHEITWYSRIGSGYTLWTVNAPAGESVKDLAIPSEIATKYPQLDVSNLAYYSIEFDQIIKGRTYLESVPGIGATNPEGTLEEYVYFPK